MRMQRNLVILTSVFIIGLTFGFMFFSKGVQGDQLTATSQIRSSQGPALSQGRPQVFELEGSYEELSRDDTIQQAGAIFVGEVLSVSPVRWNQDNGEYWQEEEYTTLPYHEIQVKVIQPLINTIGLESEATITVLGPSPAGGNQRDSVTLEGEPHHRLKVGDQSIFFIVQRAIAWRGGTPQNQATRPILRLVGMPTMSYLLKRADGLYESPAGNEPPLSLDDLVRRITRVRAQKP